MTMFVEAAVAAGGMRLNSMQGPPHGPPLLLLHGVLRRWQTFMPLLPHLAPRWQVSSLDFPGHGASERSSGEYRVCDYIETTADFVRQAYHAPVVIYGHSLGAMVAAGVASRLGERVRAVVLEDPPLETMGSRIRETSLHGYFQGLARWAGSTAPCDEIARELADLTIVDPTSGARQRLGDVRDAAQLRFFATCLQQVDPRVLTPIVESRWLQGFDWAGAFKTLHCPALLLQADSAASGMLIDAEARDVACLARHCTLVRLAGCGHNMHAARTQDVANIVTAFLESL